MNETKRAEVELDQQVKLVNCAACHKELLGRDYLAGLEDQDWGQWPRLAFKLFRRAETTARVVVVGERAMPFCGPCVRMGRHEVARRRYVERVSGTGDV